MFAYSAESRFERRPRRPPQARTGSAARRRSCAGPSTNRASCARQVVARQASGRRTPSRRRRRSSAYQLIWLSRIHGQRQNQRARHAVDPVGDLGRELVRAGSPSAAPRPPRVHGRVVDDLGVVSSRAGRRAGVAHRRSSTRARAVCEPEASDRAAASLDEHRRRDQRLGDRAAPRCVVARRAACAPPARRRCASAGRHRVDQRVGAARAGPSTARAARSHSRSSRVLHPVRRRLT